MSTTPTRDPGQAPRCSFIDAMRGALAPDVVVNVRELIGGPGVNEETIAQRWQQYEGFRKGVCPTLPRAPKLESNARLVAVGCSVPVEDLAPELAKLFGE